MAKVQFSNVLAIDYGHKRIGLARAGAIARLPQPIGTFNNDVSFPGKLRLILNEEAIDLIVIGLPRNLKGETTPQTAEVQAFVEQQIKPLTSVQVCYYDETLTSVAAESYDAKLIAKYGKDSLAAVEILADFLKGNE